jgi:hypothetical protein
MAMKRLAFLTVGLILLVSGSSWTAETPREAWAAPSDGTGPNDSAVEYVLAAEGAEVDRGTILFEYYWGASGSVTLLANLPTFPDYPDDRQWRTSFEGPTDWSDNYGTYVRGYLYPPGTGNYTFWIASDDQSELWLSTDESPAHVVQIASVPGWTPPRDFDNTGGGLGGPQQKSTPIPLTAGKRYYIEALQAEGIGGDNLAVAWQGPGIAPRTIIAGKYLAPVVGPQDVIDPNLIGWWKLQDGSGETVNDSSGHDKHGTIYHSGGGLGPNGAVWVSDPERGTVLSFDGDDVTGAYADAGTIPAMDLASGFTWAFWAKQDAGQSTAVPGGGNDVMLGNRFGGTETPLQFVKFTPGKFEYYNDDPSYNMAIDYVDLPGGQWVHHAAVKKGATLTYYRDGVQAGTGTLTKTMDENPFFLGGDAGGERWRGWLSDVRIYDRDLSAAEIRALIHGVRGEYFTNMTLFGSPALTRLDPQIYFNWGGEVFPGTWDQCSVRWTGQVEPVFTEPYTFYVNTDDGARLWLNGNLIIDAWWDQAPTEHASQPIQLAAGQEYPLRLEWYDNAAGAVSELRWSSPSTPKQVIPSARLRPPEPGTSGGTSSGSPNVTLNPASGPAGTTVTITGSGFAANTSGNVTFVGASNSVTTTATGTFSTTMTVPSGLDGDYPVQADIPSGGATEASATFTITTAGTTAGTLTLDPEIGHVKDTITVAGSGFSPGTAGRVFFDTNRNNTYDSGEPVQSLTTSPTGAFSTTLTVPTVVPGDYPVLADFPLGGSVEGTASFSVVAIPIGVGPYLMVLPNSGSAGTNIRIYGGRFNEGASGRVFFDSNRDGTYDSGEPMQGVTALGGSFSASLQVPGVPIGGYSIRTDCPTGGSVEASSAFTVATPAPTLTLNPTGSKSIEPAIEIIGRGFAPNASGDIWLDVNGDGLRQVDSEPGTGQYTNSAGEFENVLWLTVPGGTYTVWADIPRGGLIEASAFFTVTPWIGLGEGRVRVGAEQSVSVYGFAVNTAGRVFFDSDGDNAYDIGEPVRSLTTPPTGSPDTSLIVPNVAPGDYKIVGEFPIGGPIGVSRPFAVLAANVLILLRTTGTPGTGVTFDAAGPADTYYRVFFDTDRDSTYDSGEPVSSYMMRSSGTIRDILVVPEVQAGDYPILLDCPIGGPIEASATFTVTPLPPNPRITVSRTSGPVDLTITIDGYDFAGIVMGRVFFDSDRDGTLDASEPSEWVPTHTDGTFSTTLTVPSVALGDYPVQVDIPTGGSIQKSFTFTVTSSTAYITLSPTSGRYREIITITGSGFAASTSGKVIFAGDSKSVTTSSDGTFSTTMSVPQVGTGSYAVQADIPSGGSVEASASFTVTAPAPEIQLDPTSGPAGTVISITGAHFAGNTSGSVTLGGTSVSVTTSSTGTFSTTLTVPSGLGGVRQVVADIPSGGSTEASATFTVKGVVPTPSITLSPTSGRYPKSITITGSGFAASASGNVTFAGSSKSVTTSSDGTFSTTMTVPLVATGIYAVQADIPSGGSVEASATFVVTSSY